MGGYPKIAMKYQIGEQVFGFSSHDLWFFVGFHRLLVTRGEITLGEHHDSSPVKAISEWQSHGGNAPPGRFSVEKKDFAIHVG